LLEHGTVDMIIHRHDMRARIGGVLRKLTHQPAAGLPDEDAPDLVDAAEAAERNLAMADAPQPEALRAVDDEDVGSASEDSHADRPQDAPR
ncbi:MAG: acetyl-CoA carboxylase carboxyl transferase subunit beta, partial [Pseudomonadota bacterium]|nr:acetyl-CoA carboxylase carboxyl transferase subunit beta [Pseudomonadota bacterium]